MEKPPVRIVALTYHCLNGVRVTLGDKAGNVMDKRAVSINGDAEARLSSLSAQQQRRSILERALTVMKCPDYCRELRPRHAHEKGEFKKKIGELLSNPHALLRGDMLVLERSKEEKGESVRFDSPMRCSGLFATRVRSGRARLADTMMHVDSTKRFLGEAEAKEESTLYKTDDSVETFFANAMLDIFELGWNVQAQKRYEGYNHEAAKTAVKGFVFGVAEFQLGSRKATNGMQDEPFLSLIEVSDSAQFFGPTLALQALVSSETQAGRVVYRVEPEVLKSLLKGRTTAANVLVGQPVIHRLVVAVRNRHALAEGNWDAVESAVKAYPSAVLVEGSCVNAVIGADQKQVEANLEAWVP